MPDARLILERTMKEHPDLTIDQAKALAYANEAAARRRALRALEASIEPLKAENSKLRAKVVELERELLEAYRGRPAE